jgi:predicted RNA-binding protein associated with RNAse of E/G family
MIKNLNNDQELIDSLKEALSNGLITKDQLYVALNNGQITLIEYLKSIGTNI